MKRCTYCGAEYPDEATECARDQQSLISFTPGETMTRTPAVDRRLITNVIVPGGLWLLVWVALSALINPLAGLLLTLATAIGAAIDCSKMQYNGSRVLGMAFKPIVAFWLCAVPFCGVGFIWYLVLRYRVVTAPLFEEVAAASAAREDGEHSTDAPNQQAEP